VSLIFEETNTSFGGRFTECGTWFVPPCLISKVRRIHTGGLVALVYISVLIRLIFLVLLSSPVLTLDCLHPQSFVCV
jgi:hypothetical protein